ncbi:DUF4347 domain-containing protein, partial [Candidatus Pelagibacter communis]|uniref:DUF4347 domain-containing protein n=1 Tax=Pelagibacter ubique TaxID=198252 RepID=UPI0018AD3BE0
MLDGAGASTFLDLIDERNQEEIKKNSKIIDTTKDNNEVPFANTARDQNKKNVVFIDSAVSDYETIINSFKENTEFYLINSNEDGFKRISEILNDRKDIDGLHIIGHGSAGQILFGNAFLNNDTITNYQSTLASIGQSLTTSGDILFYGCNVASTEQGEILIKKISEITKADIAASDDLTGKSGDWVLEKKYGIIETENIKVLGYEDDLYQDGISGISGNMSEYTDTNVSKSNSGTNIMVKLEKQDKSVSSSSYVSQHSITSSVNMTGSNSTGQMSYNSLRTFNQATGETSGTVNSYLVFHSTNGNDAGTVTFDGEIIGIFWDVSYIHSSLSSSTNSSSNASTVRSLYTNSSLSYETSAQPGIVMENNSTGSPYTYTYGSSSNVSAGYDRVAVTSSGGTNNKLHVSVADGNGGDYIRVIVKQASADGSSTVEEDGSVSLSNGGSASSPDPIIADSGSTMRVGNETPRRMVFNDDGTKLFVLEHTTDTITTANLGTAYDLTSATSYVVGTTLASNPHSSTSAYGIAFSNDGTKMFTSDVDTGYVYQWTLTTPWDVSTNQRSSSDDLNTVSLYGVTASGGIYNRDITFSEDGTKLFILGSDETVHQISLGTAWDLSTRITSPTDVELDLSSTINETNPNSIRFSPNGKKFFISSYSNTFYEFSLATAWDLSSNLTFNGTFQLGTEINTNNYGGFTWNKDGTKLFALDGNSSVKDITEYSVSTPFSLANVDQTKSAENISTVSSIRTGTVAAGSGTSGSTNTALTGTYGQLTIQSNGSYSYVANQDAADALDPGDIVYDYFTINGDTDLTITVIGINDTPIADNETNSTDVSTTLTVTDGSSDVLAGDTDADADASLTVSAIRTGSSEGSGDAGTIGSALNGSYGVLTMAADGTYTYVAGSSAGTDSFNYTVTDEFGATDIATLTITVNSSNAAPTASNSTVYINENNQVSSAGDRTPSNITKIFAASDFNFADTDGDSLSKIKITTLESAGTLEYSDGSSWSDVTENQEITASDIGNNRLRFTPAANSESNPTFGFKVHDGTEYSSSAYTMTISVNAAPNVTDATVGSTVAAGGTSSGDVHDGVADSDDDDSVLVVTGVASGNESSNNTIVTNNTGVGSAVSGTYGSLNIAANGTYTYTASSTNNIAYGANATDIFTFTTRDDESNSGSNAYDVGTITFTVASSISLTDDTDSVNEDATITKTGSQDDVLNDDAADTNGLVVTHIKKDGGSNSTVASSSTYTSNGTSVTGTYGTLVIGADGSYTYTADQSAADDLDLNDEVTDVFVYTADGATANLTITVTGINDVP